MLAKASRRPGLPWLQGATWGAGVTVILLHMLVWVILKVLGRNLLRYGCGNVSLVAAWRRGEHLGEPVSLQIPPPPSSPRPRAGETSLCGQHHRLPRGPPSAQWAQTMGSPAGTEGEETVRLTPHPFPAALLQAGRLPWGTPQHKASCPRVSLLLAHIFVKSSQAILSATWLTDSKSETGKRHLLRDCPCDFDEGRKHKLISCVQLFLTP